MPTFINLRDYVPKKEDKFFLDTNVWLYLYCSVGDYKQKLINNYNSFYEKILRANSKIFTTSLQLSEFFNAYCKIEHSIQSRENPSLIDYKRQFRSSEEFINLIKELNLIIRFRILKNSIKMDDDFANTDMNNVLLTEKGYDFNDEYFLNLCEKNEIIVVSNDRDMMKTDRKIKIISNLAPVR